MTRDDLIAEMRKVLACRPSTAGRALDIVLEAVIAEITPLIQNEWCGTEVLKRLRSLKSNPKP